MKLFYEFCRVRFCVLTDRPMWEEPDSLKFRCPPCEPDVMIQVESVPALPEPSGELLGVFGEKKLWRSGSRIIRQTKDPFRRLPHLQAAYTLGDPHHVSCQVREEDWLWATRSQFFWPGVALPQLLARFGALVFHASCIEADGGAILFTAPSRTGKSTQAALWQQYRGAALVNGDKAAVRALDGRFFAFGMPFSGTSGVCENRTLPLRAVVTLAQAPETTIRRLGPTEAIARISANVFSDMRISEEWQQTLSRLLDLAAAVPVFHLACTPDIRAVEALSQALACNP